MIPDFDNTQKWLKWLKAKKISYKLWLISPVVLIVIVMALLNSNSKLKNKLDETKNELIPIKVLYPKLELSAAVSKLIKDYNILKQDVDFAKRKESQKRFVPLSQERIIRFKTIAQNLLQKHSDIKFTIKVLCVKPSSEQYKKATELVTFLNSSGINAKYSNGTMSSKHNVIIKHSTALPRDMVNEIVQLFGVVFKDRIYLKADSDTNISDLNLYYLGTSLFDNDGCVFYTK